jgi:NitT/TauT family transport system substrate-binding protein
MKPMTEMKGYSFRRRKFLASTSTLVAATLLELPHTVLAEPAPETTKIRLTATPAICLAPQYVAEALLKTEGFTDIQYVKLENPTPNLAVASGKADISMDAVWGFMARIDAGDPVTVLAGVHLGCYELFGTERVRSIRDLKDKTVSVSQIGDPGFLLTSSMAAYVGLHPGKDIKWIERPPAESMRLLAEGKVDAYMAFPPEPQELRAKRIGQRRGEHYN